MSMLKSIAAMALLAGLLGTATPVLAAQPGVLVTGDNLPANLDPHQIFDVPMQLYSLNAYDNLYRYEGNPPELKPWLALSHTVSAGRPDLGVQAAARRQIPRRQRDHRRRRRLQLPPRAGARQGAVGRLQAGAEAR